MATATINVTAQLNDMLLRALLAALGVAADALAKNEMADPAEIARVIAAELELKSPSEVQG